MLLTNADPNRCVRLTSGPYAGSILVTPDRGSYFGCYWVEHEHCRRVDDPDARIVGIFLHCPDPDTYPPGFAICKAQVDGWECEYVNIQFDGLEPP